MKTRTYVYLMLLGILSVSIGGCTAGSLAEFGVFGSYLDSDDLGNGYGGGVKLEVKPTDILTVDGRASWLYFDDFEIQMIPLEVAGRLNLPLLGERIVPYAGVGGGYYLFDADDGDLDDDVGFFPLLGLEAGFQRVALFAEARWLFLETDAEGVVGDVVEADVDGLGINVGLLFRF